MKDKEYERTVKAHEEALRNVKKEEEQKEAKSSLIALIIAIPLTIYVFGKICAWIAGTSIQIGPFTF